MEDRKPLTSEDVARLRAEGKVPLSHVATRLLILSAAIITVVSMGQGIPGQIETVRELLAQDDANAITTILLATTKLVVFSSIIVIVVALLATLAQTVGMIRLILLMPRLRWFQDADSPVSTLVAWGAGVACGAALWYGFGGEVFKACLGPLSQGVIHLVSTISHAAWALVGLLFVIVVGAVAVARWRFRFQRIPER